MRAALSGSRRRTVHRASAGPRRRRSLYTRLEWLLGVDRPGRRAVGYAGRGAPGRLSDPAGCYRAEAREWGGVRTHYTLDWVVKYININQNDPFLSTLLFQLSIRT